MARTSRALLAYIMYRRKYQVSPFKGFDFFFLPVKWDKSQYTIVFSLRLASWLKWLKMSGRVEHSSKALKYSKHSIRYDLYLLYNMKYLKPASISIIY